MDTTNKPKREIPEHIVKQLTPLLIKIATRIVEEQNKQAV